MNAELDALREGARVHELKTWRGPFQAVKRGEKRHEVRVNDRGFLPGDYLRLREWDEDALVYTGDELTVRVSFMTPGGEWGLPVNLCVLSIAALPREPRDENVEAVRAKLEKRSEVGIGKYGVTTDKSGLPPEQWLRHLQEELMDGAVYVEAFLKSSAALPREPRKNADGLLPCPFCGAALDAVSRPNGLVVAYYFHPANHCILHGLEVRENYLEAWNARAAVPEDRAAGKCAKCNNRGFTFREVWIDGEPSVALDDCDCKATSAPEARGGLIERPDEATIQRATEALCVHRGAFDLSSRRERAHWHSSGHYNRDRTDVMVVLSALSAAPDGMV